MQSSLIKRIARRLLALLPKTVLADKPNWQWLRFYPAIIPTEALLRHWNTSSWDEYQTWINQNALLSLADWQRQHQQNLRLPQPPRLSIVTPVFNTPPDILLECILSVRLQSYPYWQLILVDDASTHVETRQLLRANICQDPRIQVLFCSESQGISGATNQAIAHAAGDYVLFLDHDDRLSPDACSLIAREIASDPSLDIIYSDRDMLAGQGARHFYLFKPDWSPETLLSGNYIFHLLCYRRDLLTRLHGLRPEYDGSQDYDLILRAAETRPNVRHIPKALYHWRQHERSVALNDDAKDYAFQAGIRAVNAALQRRGIAGVATEIPYFSRGTFQLDLALPDADALQVISLTALQRGECYADVVTQAIDGFNGNAQPPYIAILSEDITPETNATLASLAAWLQFEGVGLSTGKIINTRGEIDYIGMAYNKDATLMYPYRGFPETEPGYMRVTQIARNISAPHPFCVVFKRTLWQELQGFNRDFHGPHALLDFALRALNAHWRSVIVPQCRFRLAGDAFVAERFSGEQQLFQQRWQKYTQQGDPYYSPNLSENNAYRGLML